MFGPSGGTAIVNGYDILTDMESVRDSVALCPQHNMLFNQLSVLEHLLFFGRVSAILNSNSVKEQQMLFISNNTYCGS
jgi:ATP-binding cassette subfamily A (ABC1) protein 3